MIPTFNKSSILPPTKLSPWQIDSTVCFLASLPQANHSFLYFGQSQNPEPNWNTYNIFFLPSSNLASLLLVSPTKEALQFGCSIAEFQKDTGYTINLRIKPHLQTLIDFLLSNFELGHPPPRTPPKRRTRVAEASISPFYSSSWLTNNDAFQWGVSRFETIILHFSSPPFQSFMDPAVE